MLEFCHSAIFRPLVCAVEAGLVHHVILCAQGRVPVCFSPRKGVEFGGQREGGWGWDC